MKADFFYDKQKYLCIICIIDGIKELRIRNNKGVVLGVKQGETTGLLGKTRKEAKEVDVSLPQYYNKIKAAISALRIVELSCELQEKEQILGDTKQLILQKDKQIEIINKQLLILKQEHSRLSNEQEKQLQNLQFELQKKEEEIDKRQEVISRLEKTIIQSQIGLNLEEIEKKIKAIISERAWLSLAKSSQKELRDSYRQYQLVKSESFTASLNDYSGAGLKLGIVAEREIMSPFFKNFFDFLQENCKYITQENYGFEVGGIAIKRKGKYTLGNLPPLLSWQWEAFKREALEQTNKPTEERMYQTVFFGNKISQSDRQLIENFLKQWKHPLSEWLQQKDKAASVLEQIRQLRNRASHHEGILYLWQFKKLWSLMIGGNTKKGILREIYG